MAAVTENLGLLRTSTSPTSRPIHLPGGCRRWTISLKGRIGWNVVTGYLDSAARGAAKEKQDRA